MANNRPSSVRNLDLDDLDQVVGGATAAQQHSHDPSQDTAFLASLHGVAAVVGSDAAAVASGQETTQVAIGHVEAAAQAQHISTDAALAGLLGATHGDSTIATELTTRLVSGAAATELTGFVHSGTLQVTDVNNIVSVATGTLAAYSADGRSALGLSQQAAVDVIDAKIDTAAHTLLTADQAALNAAHGSGSNAAHQAAQNTVSADTAFLGAFESQNAPQLANEKSIESFTGGAAAFQASLTAAAANPLGAQSSSVFGETASIVDALGSHATTALVGQMVAATSNLNLASLEGAAQAAHVSTDLVLAITETLAQTSGIQQALNTELTNRFTGGAAESELVHLATAGTIQVSDITAILNTVTGALSSASPDGHSALGLPQSAALDAIDAKIDSAAQALLASDQTTVLNTPALTFNSTGYGGSPPIASANPAYASAQAAVAADKSFVSAFEAALSPQIGVGSGLNTALASGTIDQSLMALDQKLGGNGDVESVMAYRLASGTAVSDLAHQIQTGATTAAAAMTLLETEAGKTPTAPISALASLETALGGNASVEAEMARLVTSGGATATAAFQAIEATAKTGMVDATLVAFDKALGGNASVEAEMAARLSSGASAADLAAGVKAGTINASGAVLAIETEARAAHTSVDGALTGLDTALGGNGTVETAMSARLTGGAAASDLAAALKAGTITTASAIATLEAEAAEAHLGPLAALAGLEKALGGNTTVEAEIGKVIRSGTASSSDVSAAIAAVEAVAKPGTIDVTLTKLDQAAGGNAIIEAEMAARLTDGAAAADQAAGIKAGTFSASNATMTLENEAKQAHVGPLAALTSLETAVGGNATIEKEMGSFFKSSSSSDVAAAIAAVEGAAKPGTVDATLTKLDQSAGGNAAVEAEMSARIAGGAAAADLGAGIQAASLSVASAISTLESEANQSQAVSHKISQDPSVAALAGLERALAGNASVESEMARFVQRGGNAAPAIAAIEATAKTGTVDATLSNFDKMAGGNTAVEAEMSARIAGGAAAADLAAGVKANTISAGQAISTVQQEVRQAHALTTDVVLAALDAALGGNASVEQIMASRLTSGQTLSDLAGALSAGAIGAAAAITAIEAEAKAAQTSVDVTLLAFDTAIGGNAAVETEMATRLASGSTVTDLAAAMAAGSVTAAGAIATIESIARIAHMAPDVALLALDQGVGGNAAIEAEITARLASGQAMSDLAAAMTAGSISGATAVAALEAEARLAHASVDAALVAFDNAAGRNSAVEAEMAARLANGASVHDLAAAIAAGTMGASAAIATIEALAHRSNGSADVGLAALDQAAGGNAAIETEMAARLQNGTAVAELAAAIAAGLAPAAAIVAIEAEAKAAHSAPDTALLALDTAVGGNSAIEAEMATRLANGATGHELAAAMAAGTITAAAAVSTIEAIAQKAGTSIDLALIGLDKAAGSNAIVESEIAARLSNGATTGNLAACVTSCALPAANALAIVTEALQLVPASAYAAGVTPPSILSLVTALNNAIPTPNSMLQAAVTAATAMLPTLYKPASNTDPIKYPGNSSEVLSAYYILFGGSPAAVLALMQSDSSSAPISGIEAFASANHGSVDAALLSYTNTIWAPWNSTAGIAITTELASRIANGGMVADLAANITLGTVTAQSAIATIESAVARINQTATAEGGHGFPSTTIDSADVMLAALDKALGGNSVIEAEMAARITSGAAFSALTASIKAGQVSGATAVATIEAAARAAQLPPDSALAAIDEAVGGNAAIEAEMAARYNSGATFHDTAALVASGGMTSAAAVALLEQVATTAHAPRILSLTALDKAIGGDATVEAEIGKLLGNGQAEIEIAAAIAAGTMSQADGAGMLTAAATAAHADPTAAATLLFAAQNTSDPNAGHVCRLLLAAVGGSASDIAEANFEMGIPYSTGAANAPAVLALAQAVSGGMPLASAETLLTALGHVAGVAPDAMITLLPGLADAFIQAGGQLPSFGLGSARINDGYAYTQPYASLADGVLAYFAEAGSSLAGSTLASNLTSGQTVNGIAARVVAGTLSQDQATTLITAYATIAKVDLGQSLHSLTNAVNALTLTKDIAAAATAITAATSTGVAQAEIAAIEADAVAKGSTADSALLRLFGLTQGNAAVVQEMGSRIGEMSATEGAEVASGAMTAEAAIAAVQTFATEGSHSVADALTQLSTAAPGNAVIAAAAAAAITQEALLLPSTLTSNAAAAIAAAVKAIAADPTTAAAEIAAVEQVAGSQTNTALLSLYTQTSGNAAVAAEINNRLSAFIASDGALVTNGAMAAETAITAIQSFAAGSHSVADALTQLSAAAPGNADIASAAAWATEQEATLTASTLTSGATNAITAAVKAIQADPTRAAAEIAAVEQAAGSQTNIALLSLYNQTHGNAAVSAEINTRMGTLIANEGALVANGTLTAEAAMAAVQTFAAAGQHSFDDALGQLMAVVGNNPVIAAAHLTSTLGTAVTAINANPASAATEIAAVEAAATAAGASIDTVLMTLYGQTGHNAAVSAEIGSRVGDYVTSQAVLVASGAITSDAAKTAVQAFAAAGNVSTDVALSQLAAASLGNAAIAAAAAAANLTATLGTAIAAINANPASAAAEIAAVEAAAGASTDMALMTLYAQTGQNAAVSAEIGGRINEYVGSQATLVASGAITGQAAVAAVEAFAAAGNVSADTALSQLVSATHGDAGVSQALSTIQAQESQRAESLATLVDLNAQIAAGTLSQAQAVALLVAEDANGAGLNAAQFTNRLSEVQAVQSFASRTGDYQFNNTASLVMQLIENPHSGNTGGYIRDQLNEEFSDLPERLSYPSSNCSVTDALTLIHVAAMVLGRPMSDFVTDVVALGHQNNIAPDSLLINYAAATGNDPGLISAMANRLLSGQAQTDLANAVAAGTLSTSDALTLLKSETALVQSAGAAANATVLSAPLETNVVAAQFQIAVNTAHAAAVANLAAEMNGGGYPDAATFVRINPWEQPLLDAVNHTAAMQTALAADPVLGTAAEMAGQLAAEIINSLGLGVATAVINDGLGLAQASTSTAAAQQMVADITTQANAAGVSVDAALMLANIVSGGQTLTLTSTMAGRLLDGSAEAGLAQSAGAGTLDGELGNSILTAEVESLAALNPAQNALGLAGSAGLNAQSVTQLVEAKYDLAVSALAAQGNAVAATIETALEAKHSADIIAGMQTFIQLTTPDASHAPTTFTPALGGADSAASLTAAVGIESGLQTVQVGLLAAQCFTELGSGTSVASVLSQIANAAQSTHLSQDQVLLALDQNLVNALAPTSVAAAVTAAFGSTSGGVLAAALGGISSASSNPLSVDDAAIRSAIMNRVASGTAASDLYACVEAGTVTAAEAVQTLVSAVTIAQSVDPNNNYDMKLMSFAQNNPQNPADAIVIPALSDRLIMGQTASTLVDQAITGTVTNTSVAAAMAQIQTIIEFVEGHAGDPNVSVLPGQFEAEVVLGRMLNAANAAAVGMSGSEIYDLMGQSLSLKLSGQWTASSPHEAAALLAQTITSTYGIAAATGQAIIPFVDALGAPMSATALQAGQSLVVGSTLEDQNAQAVILGTLQNQAIAANGSIDAAFTLAEYASGGGSALLTYAMTQRLANGAAEANVAQLIQGGQMDATTGLNVLLGEVNAVAATSISKSVLGLDQTTASELVIAKLDLAAAKLDPGGLLQTTLETNYARAIIAGLGAFVGLSGDGSTDTSMFGGAATKADLTLAGTVLETVLTKVMVADFADGQAAANALLNQDSTVDGALDIAGSDAVSNFQSTFNNATQLAAFEKKWSVDNAAVKNASDAIDDKIGANLQTSLTINTDPTSSVGTNSSVSAFTSGDFGNGVTAVAEVEAGYDTGAQVSNTGVAAHANAGAGASETFQFGHNVSLTLLTEAIATGSVSVGINGVQVSATVGVMTSATIDQTSDFNAGNGFSGMQDTQLQAEIGASAQAGADLTLSNIDAHFGAMAGDYFSATETAAFSSGGFTVGASGGVMSPGVAGLSIQASTSVDNGNVSFSLGGSVGLELFGLNGAVSFTLPTGVVINGIEALGNDIGNAFKSAGGDIAQFGEKTWGGVENAGEDALNYGEDGVNWVAGLFS